MIWKASWIWANLRSETSAQYLLLRRPVTLRQRPRLASAFCTASREYQLYVNGRLAGRGPSPGGPRWQPYDAHDLAAYLERGQNVIAAICFHEGGTAPVPGGFLFQVAIDSGECAGAPPAPQEIVTDESWRVWRAAPWRTDAGGELASRSGEGAFPPGQSATDAATIGELCDGRHEPDGWRLAGFHDAEWEAAHCLGPALTPPWEHLVPRQITFRREAEVTPVRRTPSAEHPTSPVGHRSLLLDFGQLVVGYPRIRLPLWSEGRLELTYGDWLDTEERLARRPEEPQQIDRVVLPGRPRRRAGGGLFTWEPFGRRAFRYLQVKVQDGETAAPPPFWPLSPEALSVTSVGYPVEERGTFRCSDPLLDEIWALGRDTLRRAMQEQFEKCPIRAPVQTVPDTRIQALIDYYTFGDYRLPGKALWHLAQESSGRSDDLLWVLTLSDYLRYSGDERLVRQLFPEVRARLAGSHAATNEHGLIAVEGCEATALNALYVAALREGAALARRLGHSGGDYEHRERSVRQALNWSLWSESEHAFAGERTREGLSRGADAHANWMVLYLDVADRVRSRLVLRKLMADRAAILHLPPAFQFYVLETLFREGDADDALDLIRSVWGEMLRRGATTCWERLDWDGPGERAEEQRDTETTAAEIPRGSLCHASSGAPTYLLPARVLGVTPRVPAGLVVRPCPAGRRSPASLEWAEGSVPTLHGPARFGWRRQPEGFELTADLPPAVQADLLLPLREGQAEGGWQATGTGPSCVARPGEDRRPPSDRLTVASWDGRVFWPAERAERGVEMEHPAEWTPEGLRVRVTGPKRLVLTTHR